MKREIYDLAYLALCERSRSSNLNHYIVCRNGQHLASRRNCVNQISTVEDGKVLHSDAYWCAESLRSPYRAIDAVVSMTCYDNHTGIGKKLSYEERVQFFDWLCNRSPYSECIVTKSAKFAANQGIILDGSYPANLVVGAIIASRISWEQTAIFWSMKSFIDSGLSENAAFFLAHSYRILRGGRVEESYWDGHTALTYCYASKFTLKNFVDGKQLNKYDPLTDPKKGYKDIHSLWGNHDQENLLKEATDYYFNNVKLVENPIPNPFAKNLQLKRVSKLGDGEEVLAFVSYINLILKGDNDV